MWINVDKWWHFVCCLVFVYVQFFSLNCFWWNSSPYCFYILLCRPSEDSLQGSDIPDGSQSKDWQSTVGWGDCWIWTQDCSFIIWCRYQWSITAPMWVQLRVCILVHLIWFVQYLSPPFFLIYKKLKPNLISDGVVHWQENNPKLGIVGLLTLLYIRHIYEAYTGDYCKSLNSECRCWKCEI
jgi:hypothetical protein